MNITKIELLWSRECPYACTGCAMPNTLKGGELVRHDGTPDQWRAGVRRMRGLGSKFVAIYGAEPLSRMDGLAEVIDAIYENGMKATLITALPRSRRMGELLAACGLDSVTCSYDAVFPDAFRRAKSRAGWEFLNAYTGLRDRAVVATVTADNVHDLPAMARAASDAGIWFLFDLFHASSGPLSKCGNHTVDLCPTAEAMRAAAEELRAMKAGGAMIHASDEYLAFLAERYDGRPRALWHCRGPHVGWLTIDADGSILPCDDWQERFPGGRIWSEGWTAGEVEAWRHAAVEPCPGCAWNTHWDAVRIESLGGEDVGTYIH